MAACYVHGFLKDVNRLIARLIVLLYPQFRLLGALSYNFGEELAPAFHLLYNLFEVSGMSSLKMCSAFMLCLYGCKLA